jgi:hypothetical protein
MEELQIALKIPNAVHDDKDCKSGQADVGQR